MVSFLIDPGQAFRGLRQARDETPLTRLVIGVKGAGEMATAVAWRLYKANIRNIFMMEVPSPLAVRRRVCFCEAVHDGSATVEGVRALLASNADSVRRAWEKGCIPVAVDPGWEFIQQLAPHVVVDAIIAKKNLGTHTSEAPLVIGLGPGFEAGVSVHMAVETNRGHNLGRVLETGSPEPNTGVPGSINGYTRERVLRAPCSGLLVQRIAIGGMVRAGDVVAAVDGTQVKAAIDGVLRGLIREGTRVTPGLKIGDIDPRGVPENCVTISEKARAIGGSVLEAILCRYNR